MNSCSEYVSSGHSDKVKENQAEGEQNIPEDGGRYWTRTSDPYRVKVVL